MNDAIAVGAKIPAMPAPIAKHAETMPNMQARVLEADSALLIRIATIAPTTEIPAEMKSISIATTFPVL